MVLLDFFSGDALDDPLAVNLGLVGQDRPTLRLAVHLIVEHGFGDLVMFDLSDPFPVEFICLRQTNVFSNGTSQEHQTLYDLRVALNAILE